MAVVTILDDYQSVALSSADWSRVQDRFEVEVLTEHIADVDELTARLARSQVVVAMRERTPRQAMKPGRDAWRQLGEIARSRGSRR